MSESQKNPRILLVDDEAFILKALEFLMEQQGYEIRTASSGEEGIQIWKEFNPELIILDVMMSGMNGFEVAQSIRNSNNCSDVKIIFLTAKGSGEDKMEGYGSGGDVYITKPFDNDELVNVVNEFFAYE